MIHGLLTTEQLQEAFGYDRVGDVCRALDDQGIPYFIGKGGRPWTTYALINSAKGLGYAPGNDPKYGAEIL